MARKDGNIPTEVHVDIEKIFRSTCSGGKEENNASFDGNDDESSLDQGQPMWKNWLQLELSRERKQLFPWQPDREGGQTEEDCDDPERLVLFDDISSSLFKIADSANIVKLVFSFLKFLGVQVPCVSSSTSGYVQRYLQMSLEHASQILEPQKTAFPQFLGLWQSNHWISDMSSEQQRPSHEGLSFIRNIFVQSLPVVSEKARTLLIETWLWYEFKLTQEAQSPGLAVRMYKDVRKLAKSLLKMPENRFASTSLYFFVKRVWDVLGIFFFFWFYVFRSVFHLNSLTPAPLLHWRVKSFGIIQLRVKFI